jgi:hypothetical protein
MGSSNLDIRGECEGPITTVLFPDDYLVSGSPNNHRLTAPEIASASPPTTDPGRSGGPIPRPPRTARVGQRPTRAALAQGRSLEGTGAQHRRPSLEVVALIHSSGA